MVGLEPTISSWNRFVIQDARGQPVDGERQGLLLLRAVDVVERRAVDDQRRRQTRHGALYCGGIGDVQVAPVERVHNRSAAEAIDNGPAKLAVGAHHQHDRRRGGHRYALQASLTASIS